MKERAILLALVAIGILIGGFVLYGVLAMDTVEYMGLKYGPSEHAVLSAEKLYYTGVTSGGAKLYAPGWENPQKVSPLLFKKNLLGTYRPFCVLADNPPVYAYTPYARYNLGEPVTIGLMDESGGKVELRNSAPFEIEKKEDGVWKTIYTPVAAQMVIPLENGTFREWTWEQQYSGGGNVGEGDYRAVIDGQYETYFTITKGAPVVRTESRGFSEQDIKNAFLNVPEHAAFAEYYQNSGSREDIASEMAFKAWMKGLDADKLHSALKSIMPASGGIDIPFVTGDFMPCRATHINYNGKPAWYIVVNWGMGGEKLNHIKHYVIDDETGKTVYYLTCK